MALVGLAMVAVQVAVEQGIAEVLKISPRQQWQAAEFCRADCVARLKTNALQHLPPMGNVPVGILQDKLELPECGLPQFIGGESLTCLQLILRGKRLSACN
ncbi:MAG: hypothetical protein EXR28_16675 [Betaproteobacteria bacterium]|nr:hypothetical protein [Betaproteobacteria bacterium]